MTPRLWANGTDQLLAGRRFVAAFGELDMPDPSVVVDALEAIGQAGAHTRVGLRPQPGRRLWRCDGWPVRVSQLPDPVAGGSVSAMLEYVRRRHDQRAPLEVFVSPRYLLVDIDHGLGDGRFAVDLTSTLFAKIEGAVTPWMASPDTAAALPRALFHTFARHPSRVRRVLNYATGVRSARSTNPVSASNEQVTWRSSLAVAVAEVGADVEAAVDGWRRSHAPRTGSAAVWLYVVRQALRAAGLPMSDVVMFAFDCRRYLPSGCTVNGNFIIGLGLSMAAEETAAQFGDRLRQLIDSGVPLAGMAAVSMRSFARARRPRELSSTRLAGAPAEVMYTDMGHIAALEKAPWRDVNMCVVAGLLDPASPTSVTVLNSRVGNTRSVAISYHDNVFDREALNRATDYLSDPMGFLVSDRACRPA